MNSLYSSYCTASMVSMTLALKAQSILRAYNIYADVVKLDPAMSKHGCTYGIRIYCGTAEAVRRTLKANGIRAKRYFEEGGELI